MNPYTAMRDYIIRGLFVAILNGKERHLNELETLIE